MRLRGRYLPLVALLGAFVAMLPAVASSETNPTVDAVNTGLYEHSWSPSQVEVGVGGAVTFRNATTVPHGIEWVHGPATGCSAGVPVGSTAAASGTEWSGTCTFASAGTYTFYCTVHGPAMRGTITVGGGGTTTGTSTTPTATGPATTPTTSGPTGPVEPISASSLLRVSSVGEVHGGGAVHGSLVVGQGGAGSRLEVAVFARGASLGSARQPARVRVGRLVRGSVAVGTMRFRVRLSARARRALKHHRRLTLAVRITLTPPQGAPSSVTRTVVEHA